MASSNNSSCPYPFLASTDFPNEGGYLAGRLCGENPTDPESACCLPCPVQQWVFPDSFLRQLEIPGWLSVASLTTCVFLLVSWFVLNPEKSHRHYLSVGLLFCLVLVQLAFVIPLAVKPEMCYNAITPRDMHSSTSCALSGAFFQAGGLGAAIWIALRSLWLHIRVCWDRSPQKTFFIFSLVVGTAVPLIFLVAATLVSGYSFKLGSTCVINHQNSSAVFWGWLLAFAGFAFIMQWVTTGYCVGVYFRSVRQEVAVRRAHAAADGSSSEPSESGTRTDSFANNSMVNYTRLRWRRLRKLFYLQWRCFAISILVLLESIFFATVFWIQDSRLQSISEHPEMQPDILLWSVCLIMNDGNKNECLDLVEKFVLNPSTELAGMVLAALVGLEVSLILIRRSIFTEWYSLLFKRPFSYFRRRSSSLPSTSSSGLSYSKEADVLRQSSRPTLSKSFSGGSGFFMGSSNRVSRNWFRQHRPLGQRPGGPGEKSNWGWWPGGKKHRAGLGALETHGQEKDWGETLESPKGMPKALIRDHRSHSPGLQIGTDEEAMGGFLSHDRGKCESMVLGNSWSMTTPEITVDEAADQTTRKRAAIESWISADERYDDYARLSGEESDTIAQPQPIKQPRSLTKR